MNHSSHFDRSSVCGKTPKPYVICQQITYGFGVKKALKPQVLKPMLPHAIVIRWRITMT
jgi:hypothetical protein